MLGEKLAAQPSHSVATPGARPATKQKEIIRKSKKGVEEHRTYTYAEPASLAGRHRLPARRRQPTAGRRQPLDDRRWLLPAAARPGAGRQTYLGGRGGGKQRLTGEDIYF